MLIETIRVISVILFDNRTGRFSFCHWLFQFSAAGYLDSFLIICCVHPQSRGPLP